MIFVTVGTHEQQFNRLIEEIDKLKGKGIIKEEVFIQTGFSTYEPQYCDWKNLIPYKEMEKKIGEARIVITHGGPASFIAPLKVGKIPIVVPRQVKYGEHVNDHQVDFAKQVSERMKTIIAVYEIEKIGKIIADYDDIIKTMNKGNISNNERFCSDFERIVKESII